MSDIFIAAPAWHHQCAAAMADVAISAAGDPNDLSVQLAGRDMEMANIKHLVSGRHRHDAGPGNLERSFHALKYGRKAHYVKRE